MWCRFGTVNKLIFDWFCGVCFSFFLFSFPFSMNKLPITRIILLPMPHRQRQSMVAVIIVFINRCHSIHEVLPKSKYYLFPIYFFRSSPFDGCYFSFHSFSVFFLCFVVLLCVSCLSFDFWGFFWFSVHCWFCMWMFFFFLSTVLWFKCHGSMKDTKYHQTVLVSFLFHLISCWLPTNPRTFRMNKINRPRILFLNKNKYFNNN